MTGQEETGEGKRVRSKSRRFCSQQKREMCEAIYITPHKLNYFLTFDVSQSLGSLKFEEEMRSLGIFYES